MWPGDVLVFVHQNPPETGQQPVARIVFLALGGLAGRQHVGGLLAPDLERAGLKCFGSSSPVCARAVFLRCAQQPALHRAGMVLRGV